MCSPATAYKCLQKLQQHLASASKHHNIPSEGRCPDVRQPEQGVPAGLSVTNNSLARVLTPSQREQLRDVFVGFCARAGGAAGTSSWKLSLLQWLLLLRAFGLLSKTFGLAAAQQLFHMHAEVTELMSSEQIDCNVGGNSAAAGDGSMLCLSFQGWLAALSQLHAMLQPNADAWQAAAQLVGWLLSCQHLLPTGGSTATLAVGDPILLSLLSGQALEIMSSAAFSRMAAMLFDTFSQPCDQLQQAVKAANSDATILGVAGGSMDCSNAATNCCYVPPKRVVTTAAIKQLCKEHHLVPQRLTLLEALAAAHAAKPAIWQTGGNKHPDPLTYPGFLEWIGRIAVIAFATDNNAQQGQQQQQLQQQGLHSPQYSAAAKSIWQSIQAGQHVPSLVGNSSGSHSTLAPAGNFGPTTGSSMAAQRQCRSPTWVGLPSGALNAADVRQQPGCSSMQLNAGQYFAIEQRPPFDNLTHAHVSIEPNGLRQSAGLQGSICWQQQQEVQQRVSEAQADAVAAKLAKLQSQVDERKHMINQLADARMKREELQRRAGQI